MRTSGQQSSEFATGRKSKGRLLLPFLALLGLVLPLSAMATVVIQFKGASANRSAEATFSQAAPGQNLVVTLVNNYPGDVLVPTDILTAVFFKLPSNPTLTRISAVVPSGNTVLFGSTDPGGVIGGEWAYRGGLSGAPLGAKAGISSAGFGFFGPGDRFPGNNLQGPDSPDGIQYGITSAGDNPSTGNQAVTGGNALVKNTVVFTLGVPGGYTLTMVENVSAQYGTDLSDPNIPLIPEPSSVVLMLAGIAALGMTTRRRVR